MTTPRPRDDRTDALASGQASTDSRPALSQALMVRLCTYGSLETVAAGDLLYQPGDDRYDLIVIESGRVDLLCDAISGAAPLRIAEMGPGDFLGELSLYTGERMFITARAREPGTIYRIGAQAFRQLMAQDAELSDIILNALYSRRGLLKTALADTVEIVDHHNSAPALMLEDLRRANGAAPHVDRRGVAAGYRHARKPRPGSRRPTGGAVTRRGPAQRQPDPAGPTHRAITFPHRDRTDRSCRDRRRASRFGSDRLRRLRRPTDHDARLGRTRWTSRHQLTDRRLSRISRGLSGAELTRRTAIQALKFGAHLYAPYRVVALDPQPDRSIQLTLDDRSHITARAVIIATGARHERLPLPRWAEFEGRGIYYAATELEARRCAPSSVVVIGGANSAGQAALFLADRCAHVTLILRGESINTHMSAYLVDRVVNHPTVTIATHTEVTAVHGIECLESIRLTRQPSGTTTTLACAALFCFIGAAPATNWLPNIATDKAGFIRTDTQLDHGLGPKWETLRRRPLPFETSTQVSSPQAMSGLGR